MLSAFENRGRLLACAGWILLLWLPLAGADTRSGVEWLLAQQQPDGSYAAAVDLATPVQSTAEALRAFYGLGEAQQPGIAAAERLLAETPFANTEYLARKIVAASAAGAPVTARTAELLSHQNPDGGFGGRPGYRSTLLDSAHALEALAAAAVRDPGSVGRALSFLLERQAADGSWAPAGNTSSPYLTALAMRAVWAHRHTFAVAPALGAAQRYLLAALGDGAANETFVTAAALLAVVPRLPDLAPVAAPLAALRAAQGTDGGWGGVYTTALALRVLALAARAVPNPDLGALAGRVLDGATGLPLAGVTVTLAGPVDATLTTVADGAFRFQALPSGDYRLTLATADYAEVTTATHLATGATLELGELTLIQGPNPLTGSVRGRVTDAATGLPLAGVQVAIERGPGAISGVDGSYRIGNLPAGATTVTAALAGYRSVSGRATLSAGGIVFFSPALEPGDGPGQQAEPALFGRILAAVTGLPLAGATIGVTGATALAVQSDAEGRFRIAPLNPGAHAIEADLPGYDAVTASVLAFAGQQIEFSPALYPQGTAPPGANSALVSGLLVDAATREALAGVRVDATHDGHTETSVTGIDGRFTVAGIAGAELQFEFTLDGYRPLRFALPIEPLASRDLGPVRLWPGDLATLLPDLVVRSLATAGRTTDPYTLAVGGTLEATIANQGSAPSGDGFELLAFQDTDLDGRYSPATDQALGRARFAGTLEIGAGGSVSIPLAGVLPFRDAPIGVWVDSAQAMPELDEDNNVRATASDCAALGYAPGERFDLSGWAAENVPGGGGGGPARWTLDATNTQVTQEVNNDSALFMSDFEFSNGRIGGTLRVDTDADDDHIGLVWGYRDERHYYLLYWAHLRTPSTEHLAIFKVDSSQYDPLSDATVLYRSTPYWQHRVDYRYLLDFRPGGFELRIEQDGALVEDIVIADDRYIAGKFGFFDHSQARAQFTARAYREIATLLPDLTVGRPVLIDNGSGQPLSLAVRVGNGGASLPPGESVLTDFYDGDPDAGGVLLASLPLAALASGESAQLRLDGLGGLAGGELFAVTDPLDSIAECSEANNRVAVALSSAPPLGSLQVGSDAAAYGPDAPLAPWARVENQGSFAADYRVQMRIEDRNGALVGELPENEVSALAAGSNETLTWNWHTGATLAGDYVLRGRLYDRAGHRLDTATAAFAILPGSGPLVGLRTTTDRARYHLDDRVAIRHLVRNLAANALIGDARLELSVTDPAGVRIHAASIDLGQLPVATARELSTPYILNAAAPGAYRVSGEVRDANGTLLASDSAVFEVFQDPAKTVSGEVTAQFDRRYLGQQQLCGDRIANGGPLAIADLSVRRLLVRLDAPEEIAALNGRIDLPAGSARTLVRAIETGALAPGDYACVLQARFDPDWATLDDDRFRLEVPPIVATLATGTRGRLLVLLDAPPQGSGPGGGDPHGSARAPTLAAQRAYLEALLARHGWSYALVTDKDAFAEELHSGGYSVYALFAEQEKLDERVQQELREAVFRGEGLLVAGGHDQRHHGLQPALGIRFQGQQPDAGALSLEPDGFASPGQHPFGFADRALRAELAGARIVGRFTGSGEVPVPVAVTRHDYGWGRAVYAGFDLLAQAAHSRGDNPFGTLVVDALAYLQPDVTDLAAGAAIPVDLTLANGPGTQTVTARLWLPESARILALDSTSGSVETQPGGSLRWSIELTAQQRASLGLWVRLPPGRHDFSADLGQGAGERLTLEIPAPTPLAAVVDQAAALEATARKGPYQQVRQRLERAASWQQKEWPDKTLDELLKATAPLQDAAGTPAAELRRAIDWQIWQTARVLAGG